MAKNDSVACSHFNPIKNNFCWDTHTYQTMANTMAQRIKAKQNNKLLKEEDKKLAKQNSAGQAKIKQNLCTINQKLPIL